MLNGDPGKMGKDVLHRRVLSGSLLPAEVIEPSDPVHEVVPVEEEPVSKAHGIQARSVNYSHNGNHDGYGDRITPDDDHSDNARSTIVIDEPLWRGGRGLVAVS